MSGVPCQLVIMTEDPINLPIKDAFVIVKQLFIYGVTDVSLRGDRIFVELTYSPNNKNLKKKFGYLPLRYMRLKIENEGEFHVLENICKKYRFNLLDDEVEEFEKYQQQKHLVGTKRGYLPPPPLLSHFGHSSGYPSILPSTSSSPFPTTTSPPTNWSHPATATSNDDNNEPPTKKQKRKVMKIPTTTTTTTTTQNPEDVVDLEDLTMEHFLSQK
ncbi:uncharacterized protein [Diabrotica undecimpunctata]|uniref:uncharacterized protein n=2 Tax=Diabrotica undecimpunctata TaxID=50387 RepID=UPI003B637C75